MRIVFMGTPDFAVPTLKALIESRHEVVAVYTKPDEIRGRGNRVSFSPVKETALQYGIPVVQPKSLKWASRVAELAAFAPDVIVVVAYGLILRKNVLELPKYGCINVHASLLPKYRGAAPIQWTVLNGERETGVTIMQMNEGLDTGDILETVTVPVAEKETAGSLFDKLSVLGGAPLLNVLDQAEKGTLHPVKQGDSPTEYASMLTKETGLIDFSLDAVTLERRVRGLYPWPSAYTYRNGKLLKILSADVVALSGGFRPGTVATVTKKDFTIATGEGGLKVTKVQPEGKRPMDTDAYLRGNPVLPGETFSPEEA